MRVLIKGAGDIASGIAFRLRQCGFAVVMTDLPRPTSIRRTVCFSEAIIDGTAQVEGVTAKLAKDADEALRMLSDGVIPVLADPEAACRDTLAPDVLVDAIIAKRNLGTYIFDAPTVIGVGPGFTAGVDCHAVVETMRGHTLGRVYYRGSAIPNTGVPGMIGGFALERILRAPCDGFFCGVKKIGDRVEKGETCAFVRDQPIITSISGILRGILPDGIPVHEGMKSGDVDPRCDASHCYQISDKALSVAGGVLEATLHLTEGNRHGN